MSQRAVHTSRSHLLCHQPGPSPAHPWPTADRRAQTRAHTHKPCAHFLNETPHVGNKYCIVSLSLSLSLQADDLYTSNVIKQLFCSCAYKFFRIFPGRIQKTPQSKFFFVACWPPDLWAEPCWIFAVAFHPSRILDNLAFRRKSRSPLAEGYGPVAWAC